MKFLNLNLNNFYEKNYIVQIDLTKIKLIIIMNIYSIAINITTNKI